MLTALIRRLLALFVAVSFLGVTSLQPAVAAMIGTETALAAQEREWQIDRVQAFLERDAVQQQMADLGVPPEAAAARVAGLTDAELAEINGRLDELPAGGSALAVIGVVFVVLLILELVGVTNIFTKI
jgi:hypothetical protein